MGLGVKPARVVPIKALGGTGGTGDMAGTGDIAQALQTGQAAAQPAAVRSVADYLRPGLLQLAALPPLALYVHLPWCLRKCPYCDFNSHEMAAADLPEARYLDALRADLEAALPLIWGRSIHSVFIGGGTPSLFSPQAIDRLLADVRARLKLAPDCEITLEANPGTFEKERFAAYRSAGVTRLSIGVQSFDDAALRALGRVHDAAQACAAIEEAARSFDTFNIDLMYALPGQSMQALERDVQQALAVAPPHLSMYHLSIEPNTYFAKYPPSMPDDDLAFAMMDRLVQMADASGLQRYEVSAFAQVGHVCAHNRNYWRFGDYLGIGAGAHSKLSFPGRIVRQTRLRDPRRYMLAALDPAQAAGALAQDFDVKRADLPFEFMLNALRLREGFELALFAERTGLPLSTIEPTLQLAQQRGLLLRDGDKLRASEKGFDFLNDLQSMFLDG